MNKQQGYEILEREVTLLEASQAWEDLLWYLSSRYFSGLQRGIAVSIDFAKTTPKEASYGISIVSAKTVKVPVYVCTKNDTDIVLECMHVLAHMYAESKNIKAVSREGHYHNAKFREIIDSTDLTAVYNDMTGWDKATPNAAMTKLCVSRKITDHTQVIRTYAAQFYTQLKTGTAVVYEPKTSNARKYICPCCGNSVRATKDVSILCGDCLEVMVRDDEKSESLISDPLGFLLQDVLHSREEADRICRFGTLRDLVSRANVESFMRNGMRRDGIPQYEDTYTASTSEDQVAAAAETNTTPLKSILYSVEEVEALWNYGTADDIKDRRSIDDFMRRYASGTVGPLAVIRQMSLEEAETFLRNLSQSK